MTPEDMAKIHAAAFTGERGWSASEFSDLLAQTFVQPFIAAGGFALTRTIAGESELLTLAVRPDRQRRGIARGLLSDWLRTVQTQAETAFLEVAADNQAALTLYENAGFSRSGLRKAYYARNDAAPADAVLMSRALTLG